MNTVDFAATDVDICVRNQHHRASATEALLFRGLMGFSGGNAQGRTQLRERMKLTISTRFFHTKASLNQSETNGRSQTNSNRESCAQADKAGDALHLPLVLSGSAQCALLAIVNSPTFSFAHLVFPPHSLEALFGRLRVGGIYLGCAEQYLFPQGSDCPHVSIQ